MTLPTEEQMTASLLEAKDVTIAELRGELDDLHLAVALVSLCLGLVSFIAIGLLLGVGL